MKEYAAIFISLLVGINAHHEVHLVPAHKICPDVNGDHDILLPDPKDCSVFYRCENGTAIPQSCPPGLAWCQVLQNCTLPILANCTLSHTIVTYSPEELVTYNPNSTTENPVTGPTTSSETCPKDGASLPNPEDCRKYYKCKKGKPHSERCHGKKHYCTWLGICTAPEIANCINVGTQVNKTCPVNGTRNVYPSDCSKYYECVGNTVEIKQCPSGKEYNEWFKDCYSPELAYCHPYTTLSPTTSSITTQTPGPDNTCPGNGYKLPNPLNCTTYYVCENNSPTLQNCPAGFEYSCWDQECLPPSGGQCLPLQGQSCKNSEEKLPNSQDCHSYFECKNGTTVKKNCKIGLQYNPWFTKCVRSNVAHCKVEGTTISPTSTNPPNTPSPSGTNDICPIAGAKLPNPLDCHSYYICKNETPVQETCPQDMEYSCWDQECLPPESANCINKINQTGHACKNDSSTMPNINDCSSYYKCKNGTVVLINCDNGLEFNAWYGKCVTSSLSHCNKRTTENLQTTPTITGTPNFLCPQSGIQYPSSKYCNAYMICDSNRQLKTVECKPSTFHYNCETKKCENITHCCSHTTQTMPPPTGGSSETTGASGNPTEGSSETTAGSDGPTEGSSETTAASGGPTGGSSETTAASGGPSGSSSETTAASGEPTRGSSETTTAAGGTGGSSETTAASGGTTGGSSETTTASGGTGGFSETTAASGGPTGGSSETTTASGGTGGSSETTAASGGPTGSSSETTAASGEPTGGFSETTTAAGEPGGSSETTAASGGPTEGSSVTTAASGGPTGSSSETTAASSGPTGGSSETTTASGGTGGSSETTAVSGEPTGGSSETTTASGGPTGSSSETTAASGGPTGGSSETTTASGGTGGSSETTTASGEPTGGGSSETTAASGGPTGSPSETSAASGGPTGGSSETTTASGGTGGSSETTAASGGPTGGSSETTTASGGPTGSSSETTAASGGPTGGSSETTTASGGTGGSSETTTASGEPTGGSSETTAASGGPTGSPSETSAASGGPTGGSSETITASGGTGGSSESTAASGGPTGGSSETTAASGGPTGSSSETTAASGGPTGGSSETTTASGGTGGSSETTSASGGTGGSSETTAASGGSTGGSSETTAASGGPSGGSSETTVASGGPTEGSSVTTAVSGEPTGSSSETPSGGPTGSPSETTAASGGPTGGSSETTTASSGTGGSSETTAASGGPTGSSSETTAASGGPIGGSSETTAASGGPTGSPSETTAASGEPTGGSSETTAASGGPTGGVSETTTASGGTGSSSETTAASGGPTGGSSETTAASGEPTGVSSSVTPNMLCPQSGLQYPSSKYCNAYMICDNNRQLKTVECNPSTFHYNCETKKCENTSHCCSHTTQTMPPPSEDFTTEGSSGTSEPTVGSTESSSDTTAVSGEATANSSETTTDSGTQTGESSETTVVSGGSTKNSSETTAASSEPTGVSSETTAASDGPTGSSSETTAPTGESTDPTSPTEENDVCPLEGALLPNPIDCSTYYKCINGTPTLEKCPDGKKYSCWVQHCELDSEATCVSEGGQNGQNCSVEGLRIIDVTNCNNYYECHNGITILKQCPPGLEFNANFKKCYKPKLAHCHTYSTITPVPVTETTPPTPSIPPNSDTCPVEGALLPNPLNCSAYFKCINGTPTPELCADGYEYSCWNQVCEPAGEAQCITNGIKNNTLCKYNGQKIQNPEDCHSYYECVNGKVESKRCSLKWYYNKWYRFCVPFAILAHCKPTTIKIPPTTLPATTPTPSLNDICPKDGALLPNPLDCAGYYKCVNSQPTPQKCPSGQEYSCWNQKCEVASNAQCINAGVQPGQNCSRDGVRLQNLESCSSYYECQNGIVEIKYCFIGFWYNRWYQKCVPHRFAHCKTLPIKTTSTTTPAPGTPSVEYDVCPFEGVLLPNPVDCTTYYKCMNNTPTLQKCPDGQAYSCWDQKCELDTKAVCIATGSHDGANCTVDKLRLHNLEDCTSYYECINSKTVLKHCPPGEEFNDRFQKCYKPVLAHCQTYSTLPTSTATPSSTFTPSPENDICPVEGILLPNPVNCSTYFKCINGTPTPQLCANGYEYNCWNQECEPKGIAQCISEGSQTGKSCKKNGEKNQDPTDCHGYLECVHNVIVHKKCPLNWWYSRWFKHCLPLKILAHCNEITTIAPVTTSLTTVKPTGNDECPEGTVIPNPNDCSTYLKCINKKPTIEHCPKEQKYSAYDQQCKEESEVQCINDGICPQGRKCSRDGVRIQNLVDCTSFYECKDGIMQKYYCFIGFKYNRWYQKCYLSLFSHCETYTTHAPPKTTSTLSTTTVSSLTSTVRYPNAICSGNGVKVPNINNCNQYYYCSGITPLLYNCPPGQNYDAWEASCLPVSQARCIKNPQGWVGGRCTMKKVTVPDATSCQNYYICRGHKIRSARCPGPFRYSVWQGRCVFSSLATCANNIV